MGGWELGCGVEGSGLVFRVRELGFRVQFRGVGDLDHGKSIINCFGVVDGKLTKRQ